MTYQALNWSRQDVEDLPRLERRWYVQRLKRQYEAENEAIKKK